MDKMSILDLIHIFAWGVAGMVPLFLSTATNESKDDGFKSVLGWFTLGAQIAFGVACFIAGRRA